MASTDVRAIDLSEVTTLSDDYDIILVDKTNNNGYRMDADVFMGLVLSNGLCIEEIQSGEVTQTEEVTSS